jgi:hypothetical protein
MGKHSLLHYLLKIVADKLRRTTKYCGRLNGVSSLEYHVRERTVVDFFS